MVKVEVGVGNLPRAYTIRALDRNLKGRTRTSRLNSKSIGTVFVPFYLGVSTRVWFHLFRSIANKDFVATKNRYQLDLARQKVQGLIEYIIHQL